MASKYEIDILIKSMFNSVGTDRANSALSKLSQTTKKATGVLDPLSNFNQRMGKASGVINQVSQFKELEMWGRRAGLSIDTVTQKSTGLKKLRFREMETGALVGDVSGTKRINDMKNNYAQADKLRADNNRKIITERKALERSMTLGGISKEMKEGLGFETMQKQARQLGYTIEGSSKKMKIFRDGVQLTGAQGKTAFMNIGRHAEKMRQSFDMSALSIMFFGMAIQRLFMGLIKMGVGTFKELTKGNTEASSAISHLEANFQLLKFTIGDAIMEALMPFMDDIVKMVTKVSDWITENKKLVGWIVIVGTVIGTLLFVMGTLILGFGGVITYLGKMISYFGKMKTATTGLSMHMTQFSEGFLSAWKSLWKSMAKVFSTTWNWIVSTFIGTKNWSAFMKWMNTGWDKMMTSMGTTTKGSLSKMTGRFLGFGLIGAMTGKLIYEGMMWGFNQVQEKGVGKMSVMFEAISIMTADWITGLKSNLAGVGKLFMSILSGDYIGIGKALSNLKEAVSEKVELKSMSEYMTEAEQSIGYMDAQLDYMRDTADMLDLLDKKYKEGSMSHSDYDMSRVAIVNNLREKGLTLDDIKKAQTFNAEEEAHYNKMASIVSSITAIGVSGLAGFASGGVVGALGMGAGAAATSITSAVDDIKTVNDELAKTKNELEFEDLALTGFSIDELTKSIDDETFNINILNDARYKMNELQGVSISQVDAEALARKAYNDSLRESIELISLTNELKMSTFDTDEIVEEQLRYSTAI